MAMHDNITDLCVASVSHFLKLAKKGIEHKEDDGGMLGYPAVLLLFSVTDAIGHHLNVGKDHTRLEVFNSPGFGLHLSCQQIYEMKKWYRNSLAHNASIVPGVQLTAEDDGDPFDFVDGKPVKIRVPQFYKLVEKAWDNLDRTDFDPLKHTVGVKNYVEPPPLTFPLLRGPTSEAPSASGMASLPSAVPTVSGAYTSRTATTPSSGVPIEQPSKKG
jgi:hypothetical protein